MFRILIHDQEYLKFEIYNTITNNIENNININPISNKLFSLDVFNITENNNIELIKSPFRDNNSSTISGIIILQGNKTYGRENNNNKSKLLYKCKPDDKSLPTFLIPYDFKQTNFSKSFNNKYVIFSFAYWNNKYPCGKLDQVIGDTNVNINFFEYRLYCKNLIKNNKKLKKSTSNLIQTPQQELINKIKSKFPLIIDRTNQQLYPIFSIDPNSSTDFDDAFSIKYIEYNNKNIQQLSIYISNVPIWLDTFDIWESMSNRVSTIYLPNKKIPLLPPILSDTLCSLTQNTISVAFAMDLLIDVDANTIIDITYSNCLINVYRNYCYEDKQLLVDLNYKCLFNISKQLFQNSQYKYINEINNSHDVVCYLMILMNHQCSMQMVNNKNGIFRYTTASNINSNNTITNENNNIPHELLKLNAINGISGKYIEYNASINENILLEHNTLKLNSYIHITSPIRRIVDLLNLIKFQQNMNVQLSDNAIFFYDKWINNITYINTTVKNIQKVQNECILLHECSLITHDMSISAFVFNKTIHSLDGFFKYDVYLPKFKLKTTLISQQNKNNYENVNVHIIIYNKVLSFKKKIKLSII